MTFDVSVAMTWVLFLALFPIAFFWLRRAWRILVRRDFSEVAIRRGVSPAHPEKFAPYEFSINLVCGVVIAVTIGFIVSGGVSYEAWSAIAGSTIWIKFFLTFALARYAHLPPAKKKTAAGKLSGTPPGN
ncbi:MAG: hypothetical protein U5L73_16910 [Rhodoferax sp.]|uniref:hypothetical protein n=1 Tax=Rhodoferax sp. TaxID=50421 RepID=UPI002ACEDCAC|nr:hypothetical protein [Rhodoferax sp.]MDZ7893421.1 hypothetical protein [Rhodoferax sp.]